MSRFILVAMTLAVTIAGCNRFPDNGLQIEAMLPPDSSCQFTASATLRLVAGRYDVSTPPDNDYIIAPLLASYLRRHGTEIQGEPSNLQVTNFEISLRLPDGTLLPFAEPLVNPYQVTTSLFLAANQARGASTTGVAVGVGIPASYKEALRAVMAESTTILIDVRAIGTTYGGFTQKSATFSWPVELCDGCLALPDCAPDQENDASCCTPDEAAASCIPGQDSWVYCVAAP